MAIIIAYDDSDGWYDHVLGPLVRQSDTPDDAVLGAAKCGTAPAGTLEGRCGFGPRMPLLVISPWAKQNFVDEAGSLFNMFDFVRDHPRARALMLNPATGNPF